MLPSEEAVRVVLGRVKWADECESDEDWLGHNEQGPAIVARPVSPSIVAFQTVGGNREVLGNDRNSDCDRIDNDEFCVPNGERRCKLALNS